MYMYNVARSRSFLIRVGRRLLQVRRT